MVNEHIWARWHPRPLHTIPILLPRWSIKLQSAWKYKKVMLLSNQHCFHNNVQLEVSYYWVTKSPNGVNSCTPGNSIRIVWWGRGCQRAHICSLTMLHVSHPYLASLSFYTISICLFFELAGFFYSLVNSYGLMETLDTFMCPWLVKC